MPKGTCTGKDDEENAGLISAAHLFYEGVKGVLTPADYQRLVDSGGIRSEQDGQAVALVLNAEPVEGLPSGWFLCFWMREECVKALRILAVDESRVEHFENDLVPMYVSPDVMSMSKCTEVMPGLLKAVIGANETVPVDASAAATAEWADMDVLESEASRDAGDFSGLFLPSQGSVCDSCEGGGTQEAGTSVQVFGGEATQEAGGGTEPAMSVQVFGREATQAAGGGTEPSMSVQVFGREPCGAPALEGPPPPGSSSPPGIYSQSGSDSSPECAPSAACRHCTPGHGIPGTTSRAREALEASVGRSLESMVLEIEALPSTLPCVSRACNSCRQFTMICRRGGGTESELLAHYVGLVAWARNFYGRELGTLLDESSELDGKSGLGDGV